MACLLSFRAQNGKLILGIMFTNQYYHIHLHLSTAVMKLANVHLYNYLLNNRFQHASVGSPDSEIKNFPAMWQFASLP